MRLHPAHLRMDRTRGEDRDDEAADAEAAVSPEESVEVELVDTAAGSNPRPNAKTTWLVGRR